MNRIELIQGLIDKNDYKKYLEIGVNTPKQPGYSHESISVDIKEGVDPNVDTTYKMTSDVFFEHNTCTYDIIFIDGDHIYEQAYRDIKNSLDVLNDNGTIVVHDCIPHNEATQRVPRETDAWHGDVWKAIARIRLEINVVVQTVDTDEGCAIITKGKYNPYSDYFEKNKKEILNIIDIEIWKNQQSA